MDVVAARRARVLTGRHQRSAGLHSNRGGAAGDDRTTAEEPNLDAGPLLEVAQQCHDTVGPQSLVNRSHGRAAQRDHVEPEPLASLDHRVIEGTWESLSHGADGIAEGACV